MIDSYIGRSLWTPLWSLLAKRGWKWPEIHLTLPPAEAGVVLAVVCHSPNLSSPATFLGDFKQTTRFQKYTLNRRGSSPLIRQLPSIVISVSEPWCTKYSPNWWLVFTWGYASSTNSGRSMLQSVTGRRARYWAGQSGLSADIFSSMCHHTLLQI